MINRKEIKDLAKKQIEGNIGSLFVCYLIVMLITSASSFTFIGPILLTPVFALSFSMIHLNLVSGKTPEISNIFCDFGVTNICLYFFMVFIIYNTRYC